MLNPWVLDCNTNLMYILEMYCRKELLDSTVITRLIEILKTSPSNLQRKVASILEFITIIEPSMETIIKVDVSSGLEAVFQQKAVKGKGK